MTSSNEINTNFFKLLYGDNYTKLKSDKDFKEASQDFDFTSIYDELAQDSDDGVVKKSDLIKALQDEIEDLGLKTEDFDKTNKSKYNTNEDTNISKLVNLFSGFDDERNFSSEDLEYLENMKVSSSGSRITLKDEDGDTIQTITLKRNSKETISSTSSKDSESSSSSSASSNKKANENILKLIYGKNYSKVKNKSEIKDFDINEIYKQLKKDSGSSKIDEDDLINAITDALYDHDDIDEETNVEEIVSFLSNLDNRDGFSSSDLANLKNLSVSSSAKSVTLKNNDKYTIERDSDGNIDYIDEKSSSNSSSSSGPSVSGPGTTIVSPHPSTNTNNQAPYPTTGQPTPSNVSIEGYSSEKINKDKDEIVGYKNKINEAIEKINSQDHRKFSTTSVQGEGIVGYTVDMGNNNYVHFTCENGKLKDASYYNTNGSTDKLYARALFDSNQLLQTIMLDKVDANGKKGNNSFAETTGVFDSSGNLSSIAYDANENKNAEVIANFSNNNLSSLTLNKDDIGGSANIETYTPQDGGFALASTGTANNNSNTQASNISQEGLKDSYQKNGITYAQYEKDGKIIYLKILGDSKMEITKEDFEKNKN